MNSYSVFDDYDFYFSIVSFKFSTKPANIANFPTRIINDKDDASQQL